MLSGDRVGPKPSPGACKLFRNLLGIYKELDVRHGAVQIDGIDGDGEGSPRSVSKGSIGRVGNRHERTKGRGGTGRLGRGKARALSDRHIIPLGGEGIVARRSAGPGEAIV